MVNAKLQFIKFDAKDVIITSGYYYMTPSGITDPHDMDAYTGTLYFTDDASMLSATNYADPYSFGFSLQNSSYYHLVENNEFNYSESDNSGTYANIAVEQISSASIPNGAKQLTTFAEIIDWITKYGKLQ